MEGITKARIMITEKPCEHHKIQSYKMRYLKWFDWSENKIKKGFEQKQCEDCGYWLFQEEIGIKNQEQ